MRPRNAVHFALKGPNGMPFAVCGSLHRGNLCWSENVGMVTCSNCETCLVEAGVLPDPGKGRARLKRDDDGGPDLDDVGGVPANLLSLFDQQEDVLLSM